jgi:hypothetical protein
MTMTASTPHSQISIWLSAALLVVSGAASAKAASPEADFKTAYAAADAAEQQAGRLRNRWTVTETALAEARKAAGQGDFDHAIKAARLAEALAKASIFQAESEQEAWKNLEIRP